MQTHHNGYPIPQLLQWGPVDSALAGIVVWAADGAGDKSFIPWADLQNELQNKLRSQLFIEPDAFSFEMRDHHGKRDWLVWIVDEQGERYCDVWFGVNPDNGWAFDGLVHFGDESEPHVWQTYCTDAFT